MSDFTNYEINFKPEMSTKDIDALFDVLNNDFLKNPNNSNPIRLSIRLPEDLNTIPSNI